jgi:uridine kinase
VAEHLLAKRPDGRPMRVGVDGITAAGKSTLAAELTAAVQDLGCQARHLSTDDFHHPRARRHRLGRDSARGYYGDAYDLAAVAALVLRPLGPGGDRRIRSRFHDISSDALLDVEPELVSTGTVIIIDGTFLQRRELDGLWDEMIFVRTDQQVARERAVQRDAALFGGAETAERMYAVRYHPACDLYLAEADPITRAGIVIDNDDLAHPVLCRIGT